MDSARLTVDREPLVLILALWELHNLAQTAASESSLSILAQLVAASSLCGVSWSELVASALVAIVSGM